MLTFALWYILAPICVRPLKVYGPLPCRARTSRPDLCPATQCLWPSALQGTAIPPRSVSGHSMCMAHCPAGHGHPAPICVRPLIEYAHCPAGHGYPAPICVRPLNVYGPLPCRARISLPDLCPATQCVWPTALQGTDIPPRSVSGHSLTMAYCPAGHRHPAPRPHTASLAYW